MCTYLCIYTTGDPDSGFGTFVIAAKSILGEAYRSSPLRRRKMFGGSVVTTRSGTSLTTSPPESSLGDVRLHTLDDRKKCVAGVRAAKAAPAFHDSARHSTPYACQAITLVNWMIMRRQVLLSQRPFS